MHPNAARWYAIAPREVNMSIRASTQDEPLDVATLANLLRETAEHHGAFEEATPPHDWWDWYAPYLSARMQGRTPEQATEAADLYMEQVRGIRRQDVSVS
jgi:phytoene dehydrogenase-like protein